MTLIVYTDGACKSNSHMEMNANRNFPGQKARKVDPLGKGGWAWWVNDNLWDSGAVDNTTNNRMELLAVIQALQTMKTHYPHERLLVVSDSAYVVNCFHDQWYIKWLDNGWRNSNGKEVSNIDYWKVLIDLFNSHGNVVSFRHVRGHGRGGVGDAPYVAGNAQADRLCVAARKTLER